MAAPSYQPYWFSPVETEQLKSFLLTQEEPFHETVNKILAELSVSHSRAEGLSINTDQLTSVLGLPEKSLPLYLNNTETDFLLSHPSLPDSVRRILK